MSRRPIFTAEEAAEIRRSYLETGMNLAQVARLYRTSATTVSSIVDGRYRPRPNPEPALPPAICQEIHPMRIISLEIQRNTYAFATSVLGQALVPAGAVVGRVKLANDAGAEITTPLTPAQIDAALVAIAGEAVETMRALGGSVAPAMFRDRPALEHVEPVSAADLDMRADPAPRFAVDQIWRTRNGRQVRITEIRSERVYNYPVVGRFLDESGDDAEETWTRDGSRLIEATDPGDLVALLEVIDQPDPVGALEREVELQVTAPAAEPAVELDEAGAPAVALELALGKRFRTRDGSVVALVQHEDDSLDFPWVGQIERGAIDGATQDRTTSRPTYTDRGSYLGPGEEHGLDLVAEAVAEEAEAIGPTQDEGLGG